MKIIDKKDKIKSLFDVMALLKGAYGVLEIIGSFLVLLLTKSALTRFVLFLVSGEIIEDPKDFIANHLIILAQKFSINIKIFLFAYLLINGIVKVALVYSLLKEKIWVYPLSIALFMLLFAYEIVRYYISSSAWYLALILFDIFFISLIIYRYSELKKA
jgi:uncharacterized membrane protein